MAEEATPARSRRRTTRPVPVQVEVGVTVAVTEDPPQFLRYSVRLERTARDDTEEQIKKAENLAYRLAEEIVERRVKSMARLVRRAQSE